MKHQTIYNRLRRIEGQVRGIEEMLAKEKSDLEILIQLQAVKSSVGSSIIELAETIISNTKTNGDSGDQISAQQILKIIT